MTWPECLDLILAILAQTPQGWLAVGAMIVVILIGIVMMAAIMTVANEDARPKDTYCENHVRDNHRYRGQ